MGSMRILLPECPCIEVPDWRMVHDIQPIRPKNGVIHRGIGLFHKPSDLALLVDTAPNSNGANDSLHDELAGESEEYRIEEYEEHVLLAFTVLQ